MNEIIKEKPLIFPDFGKLKHLPPITEDNWRIGLKQEVLDSITFIENTFKDPKELERDTGNKLVDNLALIFASYNDLTKSYIKREVKLTPKQKDALKQISFQLRNWLNEYYFKIIPNDNQTVAKGNETDSPRVKLDDLLEDIE